MAGRLWKRVLRAAAFAVILTGGACATLQVGSDYDKSVSFSNYHTFTIMLIRLPTPDRGGVAAAGAVERTGATTLMFASTRRERSRSTCSMRTRTVRYGAGGPGRSSPPVMSSSPKSRFGVQSRLYWRSFRRTGLGALHVGVRLA